jgi:NodT family efflux transporter outer membrane factor (OMF) lipoprotein
MSDAAHSTGDLRSGTAPCPVGDGCDGSARHCHRITLPILLLVGLLAGCSTANRPPVNVDVPVAAAWRETAPWAPAQPADDRPRGDWWSLYGDDTLNELEDRLVAHSPDLAAVLARYDAARATTAYARGASTPTVTGSLNLQRDRQSVQRPLRVLGPTSPTYYSSDTLGLDLEYELDLWGRIRAQVASAQASEDAARADLASARLSLQAQLADDWIALRGLDRDAALLSETDQAYSKALALIQRRHDGGASSGLDVARAQAQVADARSQLHQSQAQRAVLEHAIAALVGESPSTFTVAVHVDELPLPALPLSVPSALLQRRPDIAAAERRMAAANASVGVAQVAYYPTLTLSALGGLQTSTLDRFLGAPDTWWAIGPTLAATLFDGGRKQALLANAKAQLDESAARYRSAVLAAFQQVEDSLALIREDDSAAQSEAAAVAANQRSLDLANARYTEGAVSYLEVVTSETATLQARRALLDLTTRQRRASVTLVKALGGGWIDQEAATSQPRSAQR